MSELSNNSKSEIEEALAEISAIAGEQRIRLLGPFSVNFEDDIINGVFLVTVPQNVIIQNILIFLRDTWFEAESGILRPSITAETPSREKVAELSLLDSVTNILPYDVATDAAEKSRPDASWGNMIPWRVLIDEAHLYLKIVDAAENVISGGALDVYVLVMEPLE